MSDLVANGYTASTRLEDLHALRTDVEALGGTFPDAISNLLAAYDVVQQKAEAQSQLRRGGLSRAVVEIAAGGAFTIDNADTIVRDAALARIEAETIVEVRLQMTNHIVQHAGKLFADGAADAIIA